MTPAGTLEVVVITGLSGAGRSEAANALEDLGYFVIDNLPPSLIGKVVDLARGADRPNRFGIVLDARAGAFTEDLAAAVRDVRAGVDRARVVFLEASDEALVRRYEATRRRHPLAPDHLLAGIGEERRLLAEVRAGADVVIDTSDLNVHELRERVRNLFATPARTGLQVTVMSFGFKYGIPLDVDLVFDVRFLPNPHWVDALRPLTGTDAAVRAYVLGQPVLPEFLDLLRRLFALTLDAFVAEGKSYLTVAVGCTGGRHRSVVVAEELARTLTELGFPSLVRHRDVGRA